MISEEEYQVLATFLMRVLPVNVTGQDVEAWVGPGAVRAIEAQNRTFKVATWIIDEVLRQPQPTRFVSMVRVLDSGSGLLETLITTAELLEADPSKWVPLGSVPSFDWTLAADPLSVADGRPFIDRGGFRKRLPRHGGADTPHCLVVVGDPGGGKSYLHDFCRAFSAARQGFRVAHAKLGGTAAKDLDARTVARELALDLRTRRAAIPPPHEEPERDAENLADWLTRYTPEGSLPAVILLDEFGRTDLSDSVHRFIRELALRIQNDDRARARLRLVLMGYDPERLSEAGIEHEIYVLEEVEEQDLEDWFRKKFPSHPPYRYKATAQLIKRAVASHQPGKRMLVLNQEVRGAAEEFA